MRKETKLEKRKTVINLNKHRVTSYIPHGQLLPKNSVPTYLRLQSLRKQPTYISIRDIIFKCDYYGKCFTEKITKIIISSKRGEDNNNNKKQKI